MIGYLGILLPFIIVIGALDSNRYQVMDSLSLYYYTPMKDIFVGIMFSVGLFLISYKGYDKKDDIITNLSGIFALGIACFPVKIYDKEIAYVGTFQFEALHSHYIHLVCSSMFFILLAMNSIFLFTKSRGRLTKEKKRRNRIYRLCGYIMLASLLISGLSFIPAVKDYFNRVPIVIFFEAFALFAFGFSWLIKGQVLLKDKSKRENFYHFRTATRYKKSAPNNSQNVEP